VAVKAPYFGERRTGFMHDLAAVTGRRPWFDPETGVYLKDSGLDILGHRESVS